MKLAEGQFGEVHRAIYQNMLVVVKEPKVVDFEAQLDEYHVIEKIPPHPNVLSVLGYTVILKADPDDPARQQQFLCLVSPYVTGGSLDKLMQQASWASQVKAVLLAALGIFQGLAHLHSCDIVHRDCTSGFFREFFAVCNTLFMITLFKLCI